MITSDSKDYNVHGDVVVYGFHCVCCWDWKESSSSRSIYL